MKKLLFLVIALLLLVQMGFVCFAAPEDVDSVQYSEKKSEIVDVPNDTIPAAPVDSGAVDLPKTGGIPAETFYVLGAVIVIAALALSFKKQKVQT